MSFSKTKTYTEPLCKVRRLSIERYFCASNELQGSNVESLDTANENDMGNDW